jgi:hypothetical protein
VRDYGAAVVPPVTLIEVTAVAGAAYTWSGP